MGRSLQGVVCGSNLVCAVNDFSIFLHNRDLSFNAEYLGREILTLRLKDRPE